QEADEESIYKQILERDEQDSKREFAPLKKADDAVVVDTSEKSIEGVADTI
ncbi:MAG TPA: cytidylate kinase, partial [Clostridiales bacterium]|nr:cytidylate kinase [Clostridiales bacterium]